MVDDEACIIVDELSFPASGSDVMYASDGQKSPGRKLLLAILIGVALALPLFSVWLLLYDRQSQSDEARSSIT
jgi:hypothetical protein